MSDDKIAEIRARHEAGERASAVDDREWLLGEIGRQRRHIDMLYDQIRRRADERDKASAEVERLHQSHQAACEGGDLLRAENARLRAQVAEYFAEPDTHPVEREE